MTDTDVLIIGAGLAGLTSSIHLRRLGYSVILIEKSEYPKHKVCGEYISNEVKPYLKSLGFDVDLEGAVSINQFQFTTETGKSINSPLDMGGFGISRFTLDNSMWELALKLGITCKQNEVVQVNQDDNNFLTRLKGNEIISSKIVLGAYGKRSKLDKVLDRSFIKSRSPWIGIKAHYKYEIPENEVSLHHFEGGYCGVSMVENQKVNACYLIHQSIFDKYKNIDRVQREVLSKNPFLSTFFDEAKLLFDKPISISQIYFGNREKSTNNILMIGDTAGMIHPLAGNGMAIAIHSAKIASELIHEHFCDKIDYVSLSNAYVIKWKATFSNRIRKGSMIQSLLEKRKLSHKIMNILPFIPKVIPLIIKQTHGKSLSKFQ